MFEKIKKFYDMKLYTAAQVRQFADKKIISEAEYNAICGKEKENAY